MVIGGRGQAYYDLEIAAGPDGSTTELKLGLEVYHIQTVAGSMRGG
jgi:hypothetical protein